MVFEWLARMARKLGGNLLALFKKESFNSQYFRGLCIKHTNESTQYKAYDAYVMILFLCFTKILRSYYYSYACAFSKKSSSSGISPFATDNFVLLICGSLTHG